MHSPALRKFLHGFDLLSIVAGRTVTGAGVGVVDEEDLESAATRTASTCNGVGAVDDEDLEGSLISGSCTAASEGDGGYV